MRLGRIHLKIFLSFLVVLILAKVLTLALFFVFIDRQSEDRRHAATGPGLLATRYLQQGVAARTARGVPADDALRQAVKDLGQTLGASVWVSGEGLASEIKSFEGPVPKRFDHPPQQGRRVGEATVAHDFGHGMLIITPVALSPGRVVSLHLLLQPSHPPAAPEMFFTVGLLLIGVLSLLVVIPVARFISRPIEELRRSALLIAGGDLGHRAEAKTRDEIGELGRALNLMADRLGQMVLRGKELLAYVSHELRSPLARINVSEQLLRDRLERGEHEGLGRYLESIREEVGQMDSLLERILLLSRLDLQREPPKRELIDLTEMLEQLGQRWEPILGHRGLDLQLALAPGAAVRGDGDALSTAFSNLLDNAAKYTPAGGSVKVSLDPGPGNTWSLQVFNTTEPLPEDELEAIFRPFHRLHDRHDDRQGGSGLGLALTREIVKAHRGQVTARNTPPGFTILVSLPGERPQAEAQLA